MFLRCPVYVTGFHVTRKALICTLPLFPAVDITVYHNGFHGDLNETFFVGDVDEEAKKLVQTTYECLMQAIDSGARSCCLCVMLECRSSASERQCEQKNRDYKP